MLWDDDRKIERDFIQQQDLVIMGIDGWGKLLATALPHRLPPVNAGHQGQYTVINLMESSTIHKRVNSIRTYLEKRN